MGKNNARSRKRKRKHRSRLLIAILVILCIICLLLAVMVFFKADSIEYAGNSQCSEEELTQSIFNGNNPNTLFYFLFKKHNLATIPFVQKYDVEIIWPKKIKVTVYEKSITGYLNYMGCNMYFDKDGVIVESSTKTLSGIPQITGLTFKSIVLNSKLETNNPGIFSQILQLKQAFDKYKILVDKIYFDNNNQITIYLGDSQTKDVKVLLGDCGDLVDKLYELNQLTPNLKGLKGTLHLEDYKEDASSVIFKQEK